MPPTMRFLLDENVPHSIGLFLESRGHVVLVVGIAFPKSSPDEMLATAVETEGLVVVTFDRDFRRLIQQVPEGSRARFERQAGRLSLSMIESAALDRIADTIELIEFHYERSVQRQQRFIMQLSRTHISMSEREPD